MEELEYQEGKLNIDVYQTESEFIIQSTIGGVSDKDLEILVSGDTVTIKGERKPPENVLPEQYIYQECYWGKFSRTIILPEPFDDEKIKATLKNGILTIRLPKLRKKEAQKIIIESED